MNLSRACIDGMNARRSALQEAIGEAAGGCADIHADTAFDRNSEAIESRFQFEAASAHETLAAAERRLKTTVTPHGQAYRTTDHRPTLYPQGSMPAPSGATRLTDVLRVRDRAAASYRPRRSRLAIHDEVRDLPQTVRSIVKDTESRMRLQTFGFGHFARLFKSIDNREVIFCWT